MLYQPKTVPFTDLDPPLVYVEPPNFDIGLLQVHFFAALQLVN
jgi:hypothetical protein